MADGDHRRSRPPRHLFVQRADRDRAGPAHLNPLRASGRRGGSDSASDRELILARIEAATAYERIGLPNDGAAFRRGERDDWPEISLQMHLNKKRGYKP